MSQEQKVKTRYEEWAAELKAKPVLDRIPEHLKGKFKDISKLKGANLEATTIRAIDCVRYFFNKSWEENKVLFNGLKNLYNHKYNDFFITDKDKNDPVLNAIFSAIDASGDATTTYYTFGLVVGYVSVLKDANPKWDVTRRGGGKRMMVGDAMMIERRNSGEEKPKDAEATKAPLTGEMKKETRKYVY